MSSRRRPKRQRTRTTIYTDDNPTTFTTKKKRNSGGSSSGGGHTDDQNFSPSQGESSVSTPTPRPTPLTASSNANANANFGWQQQEESVSEESESMPPPAPVVKRGPGRPPRNRTATTPGDHSHSHSQSQSQLHHPHHTRASSSSAGINGNVNVNVNVNGGANSITPNRNQHHHPDSYASPELPTPITSRSAPMSLSSTSTSPGSDLPVVVKRKRGRPPKNRPKQEGGSVSILYSISTSASASTEPSPDRSGSHSLSMDRPEALASAGESEHQHQQHHQQQHHQHQHHTRCNPLGRRSLPETSSSSTELVGTALRNRRSLDSVRSKNAPRFQNSNPNSNPKTKRKPPKKKRTSAGGSRRGRANSSTSWTPPQKDSEGTFVGKSNQSQHGSSRLPAWTPLYDPPVFFDDDYDRETGKLDAANTMPVTRSITALTVRKPDNDYLVLGDSVGFVTIYSLGRDNINLPIAQLESVACQQRGKTEQERLRGEIRRRTKARGSKNGSAHHHHSHHHHHNHQQQQHKESNGRPVMAHPLHAALGSGAHQVRSILLDTYDTAIHALGMIENRVVLANIEQLECMDVPSGTSLWVCALLANRFVTSLDMHLHTFDVLVSCSKTPYDQEASASSSSARAGGGAVAPTISPLMLLQHSENNVEICDANSPMLVQSPSCTAIWDSGAHNRLLFIALSSNRQEHQLVLVSGGSIDSWKVACKTKIPTRGGSASSNSNSCSETKLSQSPGGLYTLVASSRGIRLYQTESLQLLHVYGDQLALHGQSVLWKDCWLAGSYFYETNNRNTNTNTNRSTRKSTNRSTNTNNTTHNFTRAARGLPKEWLQEAMKHDTYVDILVPENEPEREYLPCRPEPYLRQMINTEIEDDEGTVTTDDDEEENDGTTGTATGTTTATGAKSERRSNSNNGHPSKASGKEQKATAGAASSSSSSSHRRTNEVFVSHVLDLMPNMQKPKPLEEDCMSFTTTKVVVAVNPVLPARPGRGRKSRAANLETMLKASINPYLQSMMVSKQGVPGSGKGSKLWAGPISALDNRHHGCRRAIGSADAGVSTGALSSSANGSHSHSYAYAYTANNTLTVDTNAGPTLQHRSSSPMEVQNDDEADVVMGLLGLSPCHVAAAAAANNNNSNSNIVPSNGFVVSGSNQFDTRVGVGMGGVVAGAASSHVYSKGATYLGPSSLALFNAANANANASNEHIQAFTTSSSVFSACRGRLVIHSCGRRSLPIDYEEIARAEREKKEKEEEEKKRLRAEKRRLADQRRREAKKQKQRELEEKRQREELEEQERLQVEERRRLQADFASQDLDRQRRDLIVASYANHVSNNGAGLQTEEEGEGLAQTTAVHSSHVVAHPNNYDNENDSHNGLHQLTSTVLHNGSSFGPFSRVQANGSGSIFEQAAQLPSSNRDVKGKDNYQTKIAAHSNQTGTYSGTYSDHCNQSNPPAASSGITTTSSNKQVAYSRPVPSSLYTDETATTGPATATARSMTTNMATATATAANSFVNGYRHHQTGESQSYAWSAGPEG
eukprot:jgi/Psemu1/322109/estExt_fgenesh1_pg.C_190060